MNTTVCVNPNLGKPQGIIPLKKSVSRNRPRIDNRWRGGRLARRGVVARRGGRRFVSVFLFRPFALAMPEVAR